MPADVAERLLVRCDHDPEFEVRLRNAYDGRHDVLDALWWAAHPLTRTPHGAPDPAGELRELQRAAFSRSATESPIADLVDLVDPQTGTARRVTEAEHRLHEAQQLLTADAHQLADAIDAVDSAMAPTTMPTNDSVQAQDNVQPKVDVQQARGIQRHDDAAPTARSLRKYLVPLASIAAVLAVILVVPALDFTADADADPGPSGHSPTVEPIQTEIIAFDVDGNVGDPMAILERPQAADDRPANVVLHFPSETYRALPDLVHFLELYLARAEEEGLVCLLARYSDDSGLSDCVSEAEFREGGIAIGGSGEHSLGVDFAILTESFTLLANGDFHYEATARRRLLEGRSEVGVPAG